jgi:hypothetical protein
VTLEEESDARSPLKWQRHKDWRLPTLNELRMLFDNRDSIDGFKTRVSSGHGHWYWSAAEHPGDPSYVYDVRFSDSNDAWGRKDVSSLSCRPVRAEP